jgi:hypothetical protein
MKVRCAFEVQRFSGSTVQWFSSHQLSCLIIFNAGKAGKRFLYGFPA